MAHQLAILSERVTADAVELALFPELARRYQIYSTPALVINDSEPIFGFLRETELMQHILHIAGPRPFEGE